MVIAPRTKLLLGVTIASSITTLLSLVIFDTEQLTEIYHSSGFYFMFASFFAWLFMMLPRTWNSQEAIEFLNKEKLVLLLILITTALMFCVSPIQFRILADETNLLGIADSMFSKHSFANITENIHYYHANHEVKHQWGIRPTFFPFLIYLTHSLTGYSAYNGFIVNFIAGLGSLWCMYWLLARWFDKPIAIAGLLLLAAYPVYVLWVTASGFEIVNLCLALISFCLLYKYQETREGIYLERLILTLVLLAQTRYESAVFVVSIGLAILLFIRWTHFEKISFRLAVWPWLFLPIAWQRILKTNASDYQVYDGSAVFSFEHWVKHLGAAWQYFTATQERYATIGFIFFVALAGIVVGLVRLIQNRKQIEQPTWVMLLASALALSALIASVFSYYWGNLIASFTIRLGIIFLPFIVVSVCFVLNEIKSVAVLKPFSQQIAKFSVLAAVALCVFYWPVAAKNEAVQQLTLNRQYQTVLNYLQASFPDENNLIVADRPGLYSVHHWGAVKMSYANRNKDRIIREHKRRLYQNVVFVQIVQYADGKAIKGTHIDDTFNTEVVFESQFSATAKMRISKLVLE